MFIKYRTWQLVAPFPPIHHETRWSTLACINRQLIRCITKAHAWINVHLVGVFHSLLFKNVLLRVGITIIINSSINNPVQCWCRRLFCDIILYHLLWPPPNPSTWVIYNASQMLSLVVVSLTLCYISMSKGGGRRNCCQKYKIGPLLAFLLGRFVSSCSGQVVEVSYVVPLYQQESSSLRCLPCWCCDVISLCVKNNEIKITYL